jgi:hypothetical protein
MFAVFRVKNHDFTPKNHIFSNCGGRRENMWGRQKKHNLYLSECEPSVENFHKPNTTHMVSIKMTSIKTISSKEHNIDLRLRTA